MADINLTSSDRTRRAVYWTLGVSAAVLSFVFLLNAWVVDDAYITFRTIDNFLHGYGLRWNVDERVQSYTHPLWMLTLIPFAAITRDVFYTSIVVSFMFAIGAWAVACWVVSDRFRANAWKIVLFTAVILASKAVVDYASSGLENALSYLIAALFMGAFLRLPDPVRPRDVSVLFVLAALAFVNRQDLLILFMPALIFVMLRAQGSMSQGKILGLIFIATLPATIWLAFQLFYYGFLFPNTSYAKLTFAGIPASMRIGRGWDYFFNSLEWDLANYMVILAAATLAIKNRNTAALRILFGILLYYIYVVVAAASATHMSGRFFAVPLFMASVLFVWLIQKRKIGIRISCALAVFMVLNPMSAIKFGTRFYIPLKQTDSFIDAKWYVGDEGAALINWRPGKSLPDHHWYHEGEQMRGAPGKVQVIAEQGGGRAIGYIGYAAGPDKFIVDQLGLSDALLARIPADPIRFYFKSGHFPRSIPDGYIESIDKDTNAIKDPNLHEYYGIIREITRGPLFSWRRIKMIFNINTGRYRHLSSPAN